MFPLFALVFIASVSGVFTSQPTVIVLSFDGFKPEYITQEKMPNLFKLKPIAAGPNFMKTIFPSKTFVTHSSISTGVYPEVHGVYGNTIFGKDDKHIFNTKEQFQFNDKIVPIWIENQKVTDRHSGVMMWPGSEFSYNGVEPTYIQKYEPSLSWNDRTSKIVEWMSSKDKKANLVMAYFEDSSSHDVSKQSSEVDAHIKKVDETIQNIYLGLKNANIEGDLDMVILSDHGTKQVKYGDILLIDDYITVDDQIIVSGPIVFIKLKEIKEADNVLKKICGHDAYQKSFFVYSHGDFKNEWHLKELESLKLVIIMIAAPGKTFYKKDELQKAQGTVANDQFVLEENGYDSDDASMNAFFMGIGPKFKDNYFPSEHFDLINVYPLLKVLLNMKDPVNSIQTNVKLDEKMMKYLEENKL